MHQLSFRFNVVIVCSYSDLLINRATDLADFHGYMLRYCDIHAFCWHEFLCVIQPSWAKVTPKCGFSWALLGIKLNFLTIL